MREYGIEVERLLEVKLTEGVLYIAHVLCKYFIIATLNFYYNSYPPTEFPDWCFFLGHSIFYCILDAIAQYLQKAM